MPFLIFWAIWANPDSLHAQLRLPAAMGDGMVLQQKDSVWIWGWGLPGSKVRVGTGWEAGKVYEATVNNEAHWQVMVRTPAAGGPYQIGIRHGADTITLHDVFIGEVWICSGQSNMEWSHNHGVADIAPELATAHSQPIRLFHIARTGAAFPQNDVQARWERCDSQTLKRFSAVAYFFGKRLAEELQVPIGLIHASWGGTPAEPWTPAEVLAAQPKLVESAAKLPEQPWWPSGAGRAWNGMLAPLTRYGVRGVIWYQGESNVVNYATYEQLFTTLMDSWRKAWGRMLPFYFVQIAPYRYATPLQAAYLREQQVLASRHSNTGMVAIPDLIDSVTNIHPSRKKEVGNRLAARALVQTYGFQGIPFQSPYYAGMERVKNKVALHFYPAGSSKWVVRGKKPEGFLIAGEDKQWVPANAEVKDNTIWVWHKSISQPVAVRYAFGITDTGNLFTHEGLPLVSFRTDNWD